MGETEAFWAFAIVGYEASRGYPRVVLRDLMYVCLALYRDMNGYTVHQKRTTCYHSLIWVLIAFTTDSLPRCRNIYLHSKNREHDMKLVSTPTLCAFSGLKFPVPFEASICSSISCLGPNVRTEPVPNFTHCTATSPKHDTSCIPHPLSNMFLLSNK